MTRLITKQEYEIFNNKSAAVKSAKLLEKHLQDTYPEADVFVYIYPITVNKKYGKALTKSKRVEYRGHNLLNGHVVINGVKFSINDYLSHFPFLATEVYEKDIFNYETDWVSIKMFEINRGINRLKKLRDERVLVRDFRSDILVHNELDIDSIFNYGKELFGAVDYRELVDNLYNHSQDLYIRDREIERQANLAVEREEVSRRKQHRSNMKNAVKRGDAKYVHYVNEYGEIMYEAVMNEDIDAFCVGKNIVAVKGYEH